jgi:hypothetical protein
MARATTKADLIKNTETEYRKLSQTLNTLDIEDMEEPGVCEEWSVKDILAHLTVWTQMCLEWYEMGCRGEVPKTPAPDLTWQQIPVLNQRIYDQHKDRPLEAIKGEFEASYQQLMAVSQTIAEEDLFARGRYTWTKSTTLASYLVSCGASHYHWARELIRKWAKSRA